MIFVLVVVLVLAAMTLFGQSRKEEAKLDVAEEPIEGIRHGVRAMQWTVIAGLFVILAFLLLGITMVPLPGK